MTDKLTITVEPGVQAGWITVEVFRTDGTLVLKGGDFPDDAIEMLRPYFRTMAKLHHATPQAGEQEQP